ncbi:hypothetical protein BDR07DRAFT_1456614, partial [Suillus spraguei]
MSDDHRPPVASESREPTAGDSNSSQPRRGFRHVLRKFKKNVTKKVSKCFKRSRPQPPAAQNVDHESATSNQNMEASRPPAADDTKPSASENPGGCVNQGASSEEPASASKVQAAPPVVEEGPEPKSVDAELRDARERANNMRLLGKNVTSVVSPAKDGPEVLDAVDNIQTTNLPLQSLKNFDTVISGLAEVHPYAKVVLGVLSAASKIILAQTKRDQSIQSLLEKVEQVYQFMSQGDTLGQIASQRKIAARIAQQTLECARFIRDYSEKSFWKRLRKNAISHTNDLTTQYNK